MTQFEVKEHLPTADEYNRLRKAVGWATYEAEIVDLSLPNSLCCLCAFLDARIVGMARVIGDAGLAYYIQDVIVVPELQRQGIGTKLMDRIMDYIRANASDNSVVGLMSAKGKEPFYEKYGFFIRPNARYGAGMQIRWKNP